VGQTKKLDITNISALVAANFIAAAELANLVGSPNSIFKSSYHEGNDYNIYSYDVNGELLLAVIFGTESKPGVVWFYTKQTATELTPLLKKQPHHFSVAEEDIGSAFDAEFDKLFDADDFSEEENRLANETNREPDPSAKNTPEPMTFQQAVAAGLVPPQIMKREEE
jgi:hypothetical protein